MGRVTGLFITLLIALILVSKCDALHYPVHPERVYGHLEHRIENDSVIISYDLKILDHPELIRLHMSWSCAETAWSQLAKNSPIVIYSVDSAGTSSAKGSTVKITSDGILVKGKVTVPLFAECKPAGCDIEASGHTDTAWSETKWVDFERGLSVTFSMLPPYGMAWYESTLDSATTKRGIAGAIEANLGFSIHHLLFEASYRLTLGSRFRVREGVPISLRYYLGNGTDFLPSVSIGPKYSVLYAKKDDIEFVLDRWGVESGIAIEGPFERLSYSYCTSLGGYHKAGIFLAFTQAEQLTAGTRYEYYKFENTEMFRVMFAVEGISDNEDLGLRHVPTDLERVNNRPWWHKGLAYAGVAPFMGIAAVLKLFGVH